MGREARPWDRGIPRDLLPKVRERRVSPDGRAHEVTQGQRGGKPINIYPFAAMKDGDYFIVLCDDKKRAAAIKVHMRQSSSRHDAEFFCADIIIGTNQAIRVTRTFGNLAEVKKRAGLKGFDVAKRNEYLREHQLNRKGKKYAPVELPVDPMPEESEAVEAVAAEPVTEANQDFRAMFEQRRRDAAKELAGIDADEPDFMGVGDKK